jgi:mRNA-degrading endonuclease RelE of RelBE toxin-antitoxin system
VKVLIARKFQKQLNKCNDQRLTKRVIAIINQVEAADSLNDIQGLKKLGRDDHCYSIRAGNYRIGLMLQKSQVIFAAFDHRSDIYKYFP